MHACVFPRGFIAMLYGLGRVPTRAVAVMARLLMVSAVAMLACLAVVSRGMFVMLGGRGMMGRALARRHFLSPYLRSV